MAFHPHPLLPLTLSETNTARDAIRATHRRAVLKFRVIYLEEPPKAILSKFLDLEQAGKVDQRTPRPPRVARVHFDSALNGQPPLSHESVVNLSTRKIEATESVRADAHAAFTLYVRLSLSISVVARLTVAFLSEKSSTMYN
jgi:primary-amine oxidase